jgi:hypothetical protein
MGGACTHYEIDWESGLAVALDGGSVFHWSSCPQPRDREATR